MCRVVGQKDYKKFPPQMTAMCAAGLLGVNACFAVYDISVAFLDSRMDEVVCAPPKADQLFKPGFCWRLQRKQAVAALSRERCQWCQWSFWHPVDRCMLAVRGDDFGAAGMLEALQRLTSVLFENLKSKELGIIGSNKCGYVKILNMVMETKPSVFLWHTDVKHARAVIELMGLDETTSKPAPTLGSKVQPREARQRRRPAAQLRGRA